ncbi:beta-ketoacyl synthase [Acinetobacter sp. ANC 4633]|uniref:beta-ketoacyl synthase chain length factor n=1 Tax=Acinetobacter sp. ANC 4633 TaxID=2529845 RepID=UPI00103C180C|nr:beta-ketoacyl synthase chain length factor [Acinetobacter sp. ANC 4633]TCB26380.1 beta-ketoacyl synthase [Acinetobacter sp. ANC 4633]
MNLQLQVQQLYNTDHHADLQALQAIPAMQRRRLSALAKLAFNSAVQALQAYDIDYIVWASHFGDEQKTLNILQDVLQGHTPSPTQFSTSVHNAIAGLYSILYQDATPSTSLSCSWSEAVVEAYAFLKTHVNAQRVLVVYYDAPLPDVYEGVNSFDAFSMAAVLSLAEPNVQFDPVLKIETSHQSPDQDAQEFLQFWQTGTPQSASGKWQRC